MTPATEPIVGLSSLDVVLELVVDSSVLLSGGIGGIDDEEVEVDVDVVGVVGVVGVELVVVDVVVLGGVLVVLGG